MDGIVSSAQDEICAEGPSGASLPELWPMLRPSVSSAGLDVSDGYVRAAIWRRLLALRGIRFVAKGGGALDRRDPSIQSVEDAEQNGTRVVAEERVRHAFLGISEMLAAGRELPQLQIRLLERVARARTNGVTQADLSKELKIKSRDLFYYLRVVETCGLIVRKQTLVKVGNRHTSTNTVYFHRYGRHVNLSSTQRVEIRRADDEFEGQEELDGSRMREDSSDMGARTSKEEVSHKDFVPALEAICNRLEQASGQVLVVSDLKKDLGYRLRQGHRAWRHMVHMLKEAKLVEVFNAKLSDAGKLEPCLRLLKKFNPRDFLSKPTRNSADHDTDNKENETYHVSEQVVELPIDHQIYDMVDAQGTNGISILEICKRLGLNSKKNYCRIVSMCPRFGMHLRSIQVNKTMTYWVWTTGNLKDCSSSACDDGNVGNPGSSQSFIPNNMAGVLNDSFPEKASTMQDGLVSKPSHVEDSRAIVLHFDMNLEDAGKGIESNCLEEDTSSTIRTSKRYPCLDAVIRSQREQRILSRLEKEKFVLLVELHKWLESLETDKQTKTDKKTLLRILEKLKHEGQCKIVPISFPSFTNLSSGRSESVVLHPSVTNVSELSQKIHDRVRDFDYFCRSQRLSQVKINDQSTSNDQSITVLTNVERLYSDVSRVQFSEAMDANGFIPPKMVRAKLLHMFLWSHLNCCEMEIYSNSLKAFNMKAAIDVMPVELFLQVAGSHRKVDDLIRYCQQGLKLSDLPIKQYRCLLDTPATCRLSSILDILVRLKLIRLVTEDSTVDGVHVVLTHGMELKPYIEQPRGRDSSDHRPRVRHDFVFSKSDAVDSYWQILEDSYATADPNVASHAFPGSAVAEVCSRRSWSSLRVMSMEQRVKLSEHISSNGPSKKTSSRDCSKIARELNLSPDQVLRASYRMQQSHKLSSEPNADDHKDSNTMSVKKRKSPPEIDHEIDIRCDRQPLPKVGKRTLEAEISVEDNQYGSMSENVAELEVENENDEYDIISDCTFKMLNSRRRRRAKWNDELDRQLIMQYTRYRVTRGININRVDWHSLPDLPASPGCCRRRMALLNQSTPFRNAVMGVCNLLSERYTRYLDDASKEGFEEHDKSTQISPSSHVMDMDLHLVRDRWDNFEDPKIKMAIDQVLQCKRLNKLGLSFENQLGLKRKYTDSFSMDAHSIPLASSDRENCQSAKSQDDITKVYVRRRKRGNCPRVAGRILKLLSNADISITKRVADSLSLANAVELIKLVFLSSSETAEVQTFLVETLKQYAKSDVFAAVTFLKEKNFMVPGHGNRPFVLSQKFITDASSSPYPFDTGKRSAMFSSLIHKEKEDLVLDGLDFPLDMQCGEILHLFSLVTLGEATLSICMPEEGVGDVDEPSNLKQNEDMNNCDEIKKAEVLWMKDGEFCLRREKGFPGIKVAINHTCSEPECIGLFKNNGGTVKASPSECYSIVNFSASTDDLSTLESSQELADSCLKINLSGSLWQAMADYTHQFLPDALLAHTPTSGVIRSVYIAIKQSGEQGLSIHEITEVMVLQALPGNLLLGVIIDTLVVFQKVVKVNAYDCVRVIDASYKSKYYIPMLPSNEKNPSQISCNKRHMANGPRDEIIRQGNDTMVSRSGNESNASLCDGHKVSILDLPEETEDFAEAVCSVEKDFPTDKTVCDARPILPWISGNGSTNNIMYKGLVRRLLGIVMQNPGILEEDLITVMDVLNPQSCRQLLELLILDNHVTVRKIYQTPTVTLPILLQGLVGSHTQKSEPLFRNHLFANPLSTHYL